MARYKHLFEHYGIIATFFAVALMVTGTGCQPKVAKELGVDEMTQAELGWTAVKNMQEIDRLRLKSPSKAIALAKRNLLVAGYIGEDLPWSDARGVALNQLVTLTGAAATGGGLSCKIEVLEDRLMMNDKFSLKDTDDAWMLFGRTFVEGAGSTCGIDDVDARVKFVFYAAPPDEMFQVLNNRRLKAERQIDEATAIFEQTGDRIPLLCAKAEKARVESDWLIKWRQVDSDQRCKYDAKAKRCYAEAKALYKKYHQDRLAPFEPVRYLAPITSS